MYFFQIFNKSDFSGFEQLLNCRNIGSLEVKKVKLTEAYPFPITGLAMVKQNLETA
jgi:hypothetical protein